jgi:hypothetical protein
VSGPGTNKHDHFSNKASRKKKTGKVALDLSKGVLMFAVLNVDAMVRSSLPHGGLFP